MKKFMTIALTLSMLQTAAFAAIPAKSITLPSGTTTSNAGDSAFQSAWSTAFKSTIPSTATFQSFQTGGDRSQGFHAQYYPVDVNYRAAADSSMPQENLYAPGTWNNRDSGRTLMGRLNLPSNFLIKDATSTETPNNPTIVINTSSKLAFLMNAGTRPTSGGSMWAYMGAGTHAGSGLSGGEVSSTELSNGVIPHALAINVWGKKYLSSSNGGYVYPATKADSGYNNSSSGNYYGGKISTLKMGTRVGIPASVTAQSLNITSREGLALLNTLKKYGAYIVDNSAWDAVYINATPQATSTLVQRKSEISRLFGAVRIVR